MKLFITLIILFSCLKCICQSGNGDGDCRRMLSQAQKFSDSGYYEASIKKLSAVAIHCPGLTDSVNQRLLQIYTDINKAKNNEKRARENAELEKEKAISQARISEAARFAAEAESNLVNYPASMNVSAQYAIKSMQLNPAIQGDKALRKILGIMAPLENSVFAGVDPAHIANNGGWLAIGGFYSKGINDAMVIMNINTRRTVKFIEYSNYTIDDIVITNDGKYIAVAMSEAFGPSYKVEILNTTDWSSIFNVTGQGYFGRMAFSNEYNCLLYYAPGSPIQVYDVISEKVYGLPVGLSIDMAKIEEIRLVKNDQYAVIRSDAGLAVWDDWKSDNPKRVFFKSFYRNEYTNFYEIPFSFTNDGSCMAIATRDSLNIFSLPSFKLIKVSYVPGIRAVKSYPKDNNFITYSINGCFDTWDSLGTKKKNVYAGLNSLNENQITFAANVKYAVTIRRDDAKTVNDASFWDMESGIETARVYHDNYIVAVYPLHKGTAAISVGKDQEVRFWGDIQTKETAVSTKNRITSFTINEAGTHLAIATGATMSPVNEITIIDHGNNNIIRTIKNQAAAGQVRFSPDNKDILLLTKRGLEIWKNWESPGTVNELLYEIPLPERLKSNAIGFNKKGNIAAICNGNGKIYVLYGPLWKSVKVISCHNPVSPSGLDPSKSELILSNTGKYIAVVFAEGIAIIDTRNNKQIHFLKQNYQVDKIAFTHDEKSIVFISGIEPKEKHKGPASELVCIDIANPGKRSRIPFGDVYIGAIAVSSDARMLAIGLGKFIRVYRFPDKTNNQFQLISEIMREQTIRICEFTGNNRYIVSCFNDFLSGDRILFSLVRPADLITAVKERLGSK